MPNEHFEAFAEAVARSHAEDGVASGKWAEHESEQLARSEFDRLLPQGLATPSHYLYEVIAETNSSVIGFVWFGTVPRRRIDVAFVSGQFARLPQLFNFL